jgi:outer membrane protein assembly factor BamB
LPGNLTRRQLLAAFLTSSAIPSLGLAAGNPGGSPKLLRRWNTNNTLLAPLTQHNGQLLFAGNHTLGRIDPSTARPVWNTAHNFSTEAVFRPRVAGKTVIAAGLKELGAWSLDHGQRKWLRLAQIQIGVPWVTPNFTYVGDGHELLAIHNADGSEAWRFAGTSDTLASYAPTVAGDSVLFAPGNGLLYALSTSDGKLKWQLDRSDEWQYLRQLYVTGNVLVAGSYKELLYGISVHNGKVLWTFNAGNFINSHHVSGDTAYLWSPTGWLYAIDVQNGHVRWRHQTTNYGPSANSWGPMMAELTTQGEFLYALDMSNVLHVLSTLSGKEVYRLTFTQDLRPTVVPLSLRRTVVATEEGEILLLQT